MKRAKVHEVSSPISLYPFIGILLCTMGALLVVLIAVSRSARTTAERQVQSKQQSAAKPASDSDQQKLDEIKKYVGDLGTVHNKAVRKLRDEQLRLSHIEDHIRRLREKIQSLQSAAAELHAMEEEHYDDREQAERETQRLHQLIGDSQKAVESLREAGSKESRSYAVVPYEGPNGTFRRPIYIECVNNELVLQPEGVRLTADDLQPPLGPGNPLATVLRASRDHILKQNPQLGNSRDTEPYALLLVRPEGYLIYYRARRAVEAGDFDLGYELVESDWKLKFPQPDPLLADAQQQALEQSRARQVLLAAAAPRAYRNASMVAAGEFDFDDGPGGGGGAGGNGTGPGAGGGGTGGSRAGGGARTYLVSKDRSAAGEEQEYGTGSDAGNSGGTPKGGDGAANAGAQSSGNTGASAPANANGVAGAGGSSGNGGGPPPAGKVSDKNLVPDGYETQHGGSVVAGTSAPGNANTTKDGIDPQSAKDRMNSVENRGKDWALSQKPARSVPIRRTIHVAVRDNQLAILPDSGPVSPTAPGKAIPIQGDTVESLDEFVKHVREHIDAWGIAGDGLYWRPVVLLSFGPDGQRRASDLARLLKNSGLEIRTDDTARNSPQGSNHETR